MVQRAKTYEKYEMMFANIIPAFKDIRLNRLKPEHFDDFLLSLKENKRSSNTIHHYYIIHHLISAQPDQQTAHSIQDTSGTAFPTFVAFHDSGNLL